MTKNLMHRLISAGTEVGVTLKPYTIVADHRARDHYAVLARTVNDVQTAAARVIVQSLEDDRADLMLTLGCLRYDDVNRDVVAY